MMSSLHSPVSVFNTTRGLFIFGAVLSCFLWALLVAIQVRHFTAYYG
jgi:hypothetical protein